MVTSLGCGASLPFALHWVVLLRHLRHLWVCEHFLQLVDSPVSKLVAAGTVEVLMYTLLACIVHLFSYIAQILLQSWTLGDVWRHLKSNRTKRNCSQQGVQFSSVQFHRSVHSLSIMMLSYCSHEWCCCSSAIYKWHVGTSSLTGCISDWLTSLRQLLFHRCLASRSQVCWACYCLCSIKFYVMLLSTWFLAL